MLPLLAFDFNSQPLFEALRGLLLVELGGKCVGPQQQKSNYSDGV